MSRRTRLLAIVLGMLAGGADAIGLLGFGMFTAHVTGNLALLAVSVGTRRPADLALLLSIPVFVVAVVLVRQLTDRLQAAGRGSLRPLLLTELLLLAGFAVLGLPGGLVDDAGHRVTGTIAVLLAVAAMGVQNALVLITLPGVPSTTVMTTNLTRFGMAGGDLLARPGPEVRQGSRHQLARLVPVLLGFVAGAGLGALCFAWWGRWSALLVVGLAGLGLAIGRQPPLERSAGIG